MKGYTALAKSITFNDLHEVVNALTTALDAKSHYTCGHSERVAEFALLLSKGLALSLPEQRRIHIGAHLHDIGKIGIPDAILNKTGKLTSVEFQIMQKHPLIGDNIVRKMKVFHDIVDIVRFHHERFDGNGYPDGLSGTRIPIGARIVAVADALDAMISCRPYRSAYSFEAALEEVSRCSGTQFDPLIVNKLLELHRHGHVNAKVS